MQRQVFGQPVFDYQASMLRVFVDHCLALHLRGQLSVDRSAEVKLVASGMQNRLLDEFLQAHGGYGYMSVYAIGRAWADARVGRIFGGSSEIMKEIIARTL